MLSNQVAPERTSEHSFSELETKLDLAQRKLQSMGIPLLILVDGWESSGKGYLIGHLRREMDPRFVTVRMFDDAEAVKSKYPEDRLVWQELPPHGKVAIFDRSYYTPLFTDLNLREDELRDKSTKWLTEEILWLDDRMVIVKLFLDISKETQKENIEALESDPYSEFLVSKRDRKQNENYETYRTHMARVLSATDTPYSPWHVVSMEDRKNGTKAAMQIVLDAMEQGVRRLRQDRTDFPAVNRLVPAERDPDPPSLQTLEQNKSITKEEYDERLPHLQKQLRHLVYGLYRKKIPLMIVFEGSDAAGKGGTIKRLTKEVDPRSYRIHPTSAPTAEELLYQYMHRFVTKLPSHRQMKVFDRSWYGRVLVERVEGFANPREWKRAYGEINALEELWRQEGIHTLKFYLAIDKDEQQQRFEAREDNPLKQYKLTDEDWRNREKWDQYIEAADDMFQRTSTKHAPWHLIPANDKRYARLEVLQIIASYLERLLEEADS